MKLHWFKFIFLLLATITLSSYCVGAIANAKMSPSASVWKKLEALEASSGGKIGLYAINTANNHRIQYRASERFPIQSTFKLMAVSAILKQSMANKHLLQQNVIYTNQDLVFWSPITKKHIRSGMSMAQLCAASMMYSDNAATNLIIKKLGGPLSVTLFARSIGDKTFQLMNVEPELNSNPNDSRDTSTPKAMGLSLQKLALGNILAPSERMQLVNWMKGSTTGDTRIRAAVPKEWMVADKTGSGGSADGISNDIGIIWPPSCPPIVLAIYSYHIKKDVSSREDVTLSATRIVLNELAKNDSCILKHSLLSKR